MGLVWRKGGSLRLMVRVYEVIRIIMRVEE